MRDEQERIRRLEPTPTRKYEPADRPVQILEYVLFVALDTAAFAAFIWPGRLVIGIGIVIALGTLAVSLARLLLPTVRFSLTRAIFAVLAVLVLLMLLVIG
jgi:hypothetical protein